MTEGRSRLSDQLHLYSYWRSSAAYRVRIGLNLKGLAYETLPVHLVRDGGEQHSEAYRKLNPQELVPVFKHGDRVLRQSLAILEYLDETWPEPALLPATSRDRQRARAIAYAIACDIHPLNNLRVLQYFDRTWNVPQPERDEWVRHWVVDGLSAVETVLNDHPSTGEFCEGDIAGLAECCVIAQGYNARRFGVDIGQFPTIARIDATCMALPAFQAAKPENQPDAPQPN